MNRLNARLRGIFVMLASSTFALCTLAAVAATSVLAFAFGAEAELVVQVLVLGVLTAVAETAMRTRT